MLVQRGGEILGNDKDPLDVGVQGIGNGDVDQTVTSAEANCWFTTSLS